MLNSLPDFTKDPSLSGCFWTPLPLVPLIAVRFFSPSLPPQQWWPKSRVILIKQFPPPPFLLLYQVVFTLHCDKVKRNAKSFFVKTADRTQLWANVSVSRHMSNDKLFLAKFAFFLICYPSVNQQREGESETSGQNKWGTELAQPSNKHNYELFLDIVVCIPAN